MPVPICGFSNTWTTYGQCIKSQTSKNLATIKLSNKLLMYAKEEEIKNVILHELSHAVIDLTNIGHKKGWQKIANQIGNHYNIVIRRLADFSLKNRVINLAKKAPNEVLHKDVPKVAFTITCPDCVILFKNSGK